MTAEATRKKKSRRAWLPFIGLTIFGLLIYKIGIAEIVATMTNLQGVFLYPLPALMFFLLAAQTLRWQWVLAGDVLAPQAAGHGLSPEPAGHGLSPEPAGHGLSPEPAGQLLAPKFFELFKINLIGGFYGAITPGNVGNLLKIDYLASLCGRSRIELMILGLYEKFIEIVVLLFFVAIGAAVLIRNAAGNASLILLFFPAIAALGAFVFRNAIMEMIKRITLKYVSSKFPQAGRIALAALKSRSATSGMQLILISVVIWLAIWGQMFLIAKALSMNISFPLFVVIVSISSLTALIPVSINGLGTRELALIPMLSEAGVAPEITISMSLLSILWCAYVPAALGALFSMFYHVKNR